MGLLFCTVLVIFLCWSVTGQRSTCNYVTMGHRRNPTVNIADYCARGTITWHYPRHNLEINFDGSDERRVCFDSGIDFRGGAKVRFQSFGSRQYINSRVIRSCRNLDDDTSSVVAVPKSRYFMVTVSFTVASLDDEASD